MPPYLSVGLLSAAALGYEVLLVRLFAVIQWHHFAAMVISLALLGYGASGSFLALAGGRLTRIHAWAFPALAAAFAPAAVGCFLAAQAIAFNPLELPWEAGQILRLAASYVVLCLPFFAVASAVGLTLACAPGLSHRIYAYDLGGAAAGSLLVLGLLTQLPPERCLTVLAALGIAAAALAAWRASRPAALLLGLAAATLPLLPPAWLAPRPSPYKGLSQALEVHGARVLAEASGPLGRVTVLENPAVPFREAPGLSPTCAATPPEQLAIFVDGEGLGVISRPEAPHLGCLATALPYRLLAAPTVLVLNAGGGEGVLQALRLGAREVDAVEPNSQLVALLRGPFAAYSGRIFEDPRVRTSLGDARGFVTSAWGHWDLIQFAFSDAYSASAAGLTATAEDYHYTVEAFRAYLSRLAPGGMLAVTRWLNLPPRDTLKLVATLRAALEAEGVKEPGRRLVLVRSWKTVTLLAKNGEFNESELTRIREFCREQAFDLEWPAAGPAHNLLPGIDLPADIATLLGPGAERFTARYRFHIAPASDDRPFFFRFFRWESASELWRMRGAGGLALLEWGYLTQWATLIQALVLSALLILLPLRAVCTAPRVRVFAYFSALGLAFMFLEIAFIQRFVLFLAHPTHAVATVLAGFLVFAGLGSRWSERLVVKPLLPIAAGIGALSLVYLLALPPLFADLAGLALAPKMALTLVLVAPLAFLMGTPFPLGLAALEGGVAVPWAWGINGCASVVGTLAASLVAVHFGFAVVVGLAAALYLVAAACFPAPKRPR